MPASTACGQGHAAAPEIWICHNSGHNSNSAATSSAGCSRQFPSIFSRAHWTRFVRRPFETGSAGSANAMRNDMTAPTSGWRGSTKATSAASSVQQRNKNGMPQIVRWYADNMSLQALTIEDFAGSGSWIRAARIMCKCMVLHQIWSGARAAVGSAEQRIGASLAKFSMPTRVASLAGVHNEPVFCSKARTRRLRIWQSSLNRTVVAF